MDIVIDDTDWKLRAAGLVSELATHGVLNDPVWASAFAATPRHLFTLRVVADDGAILLAGHHRWLPTASSSTPPTP